MTTYFTTELRVQVFSSGSYIVSDSVPLITTFCTAVLSLLFRADFSSCDEQDMAEMYVGDDVSPDFYGWVFPKYDHVGVGTGTVVNRPAIKDYQVKRLTFIVHKLIIYIH